MRDLASAHARWCRCGLPLPNRRLDGAHTVSGRIGVSVARGHLHDALNNRHVDRAGAVTDVELGTHGTYTRILGGRDEGSLRIVLDDEQGLSLEKSDVAFTLRVVDLNLRIRVEVYDRAVVELGRALFSNARCEIARIRTERRYKQAHRSQYCRRGRHPGSP